MNGKNIDMDNNDTSVPDPEQSCAFQVLLVQHLQQVVLLHHLFLQSVIKLLPQNKRRVLGVLALQKLL